ncbi:NAD-dependent epimerase/dehydratase family protein [Blastococcus sp. SYSU D00669]
MRVLVLGATGYIGSVVTEHLAAGGHRVVALRRPDAPPRQLGHVAETRWGDVTVPDSLAEAVTDDIDAVVDVAVPTGTAAVDAAANSALLAPLHGTGRPFLYTSGIWVLGPAGALPADEDSPTAPIELVRDRPAIERQVLAAAERGVRAVVLRPAIVHGRGSGIPALLVELARRYGGGRFVGGPGRWPMVHVDDLADLYVRALERGVAGSVIHAVAEEAVPVVDLAAAAARAAGVAGPVEAWPIDAARAELGSSFADALALDQVVSGARARRLGWRPRAVSAAEDLAAGSYISPRAA